MAVRALVFDFDGLILETEEPEFLAWRSVWADHGLELTLDEWVDCIGTVGGFDPLAELRARATVPVDVDGVVAVRRARNRALLDAAEAMPGVAEMLEAAHERGLKTAVASSSLASWVVDHLGRMALLDRFAHVSCFDGKVRPKPAPDLYLAACDALGVAPPEAVAFEDSPNGVAAAKAAGLWCVAVPSALTRDLDLSAADVVVTSMAEVTLDDVLARFG